MGKWWGSIPMARRIRRCPQLEPRRTEEARPRTAPVRRRRGTAVRCSGDRRRRVNGVLGSQDGGDDAGEGRPGLTWLEVRRAVSSTRPFMAACSELRVRAPTPRRGASASARRSWRASAAARRGVWRAGTRGKEVGRSARMAATFPTRVGILTSRWRVRSSASWRPFLGLLGSEFGHEPRSKVGAHSIPYNFY
jgi:hypothetical protein